MIQKIDHLGVVVHSLAETVPLYRDVLGFPFLGEEVVPDGTVKVAFFQVGDVKVELIESISNTGVDKFLEKRGPGIHHVCYLTDDIEAELQYLANEGCTLIDQVPRDGAHDMRVAFVHPKAMQGVLVELAQPKDGAHA